MYAHNAVKYIKPGDIVVIAAVVLSASLLFLCTALGKNGSTVHIECFADGTQYSLSLGENTQREISANGYHLTVTVSSGQVFVSESDCPGHDCMARGKVSAAGGIIVCAPARVVISITGEGENGYDAVAG